MRLRGRDLCPCGWKFLFYFYFYCFCEDEFIYLFFLCLYRWNVFPSFIYLFIFHVCMDGTSVHMDVLTCPCGQSFTTRGCSKNLSAGRMRSFGWWKWTNGRNGNPDDHFYLKTFVLTTLVGAAKSHSTGERRISSSRYNLQPSRALGSCVGTCLRLSHRFQCAHAFNYLLLSSHCYCDLFEPNLVWWGNKGLALGSNSCCSA